jgi:Cu/Ag efflux protein CusF
MVKFVRYFVVLLIFVIFSANSFGEEIFSTKNSSGRVTSITESQITISTFPTTTANISDSIAVFDRDGNQIQIKDIKVGNLVEVSFVKIDGKEVIKQIQILR